MANFTSYMKETLQERLQREAKEKLGGVLLATGGTELDTIIAYTISETIKAGVSAIGGEHRCCLCEKPAPKDTPALSIEDFHPIVQSVFRIEKGKEEGLEWPLKD